MRACRTMSATVVSRYPRSPIDAASPSSSRSGGRRRRRTHPCRALSSFRLPESPCACLVPSGTVLQIPTVHRSTRETAGSDSLMTDTAVTVDTKTPTTPGKMPPVVRLPKPVQGLLLSGFRRWFLRNAVKRYGPVFAINVPFFGRSVVVSDPALAAAGVPREHRRPDQRATQPQQDLRTGFGLRVGRQGTSGSPQAARPAVPRPEHQELRKGHRGGDASRDRDLAGGRRVSDARTDEQDHAECHPAHRVRGRRRGTRLPARDHSAVGEAGIADGHAAGAAVQHGALQPVGQARGVPPQLRPHRLRADRQGRSRPAPRRAHRHSGAAAAQHDTRTAPRCRARTSPTSC